MEAADMHLNLRRNRLDCKRFSGDRLALSTTRQWSKRNLPEGLRAGSPVQSIHKGRCACVARPSKFANTQQANPVAPSNDAEHASWGENAPWQLWISHSSTNLNRIGVKGYALKRGCRREIASRHRSCACGRNVFLERKGNLRGRALRRARIRRTTGCTRTSNDDRDCGTYHSRVPCGGWTFRVGRTSKTLCRGAGMRNSRVLASASTNIGRQLSSPSPPTLRELASFRGSFGISGPRTTPIPGCDRESDLPSK
jgi:hypothetical protein